MNSTLKPIPQTVRDTIKRRYDQVRELQRQKRCYIRTYGMSRGLFEYRSNACIAARASAVVNWLYVRQLMQQNGYEACNVLRELKGVAA